LNVINVKASFGSVKSDWENMIVIVPSATITLPILIIWVSEMQKRCIGCNVVIGHKKHYCFRCLTELTEKAGENNE